MQIQVASEYGGGGNKVQKELSILFCIVTYQTSLEYSQNRLILHPN